MYITVDCSAIRTRDDLHRIIREALSLPHWYGCNLDALFDCLTGMQGTLRLENWQEAEAALGRYGIAARKAILSAALENTALDVIL